jgi:hypothetical protein
MREHLHLTNIASKLRRAAVDEPLGEPPLEIRLLLEKLGERELVRRERDATVSNPPTPASPGAG